jgi:hypothetical protein
VKWDAPEPADLLHRELAQLDKLRVGARQRNAVAGLTAMPLAVCRNAPSSIAVSGSCRLPNVALDRRSAPQNKFLNANMQPAFSQAWRFASAQMFMNIFLNPERVAPQHPESRPAYAVAPLQDFPRHAMARTRTSSGPISRVVDCLGIIRQSRSHRRSPRAARRNRRLGRTYCGSSERRRRLIGPMSSKRT